MGPCALALVTFGDGRTLYGGFRKNRYLIGVLTQSHEVGLLGVL